MPKISIILPVYNVEKYIAKSIRSVLDQTYVDFELLVIIDGSPDNSKAIAESYLDNRITVYEKPNGGLSDARNFGLERAKGDFVYFMDSDDWIEPDLVEQALLILEKKSLDLVIFGYIQDNEDSQGNLIGSKPMIPTKDAINRTENNIHLDRDLLGILGYAWNKVFRTSLLMNNKLVFEKGTSLVEDIVFNSQVYLHVDELCFINKGLYHYVNRPEQTLMKMFHDKSLELKVKKNEYLEVFFNNWNITDSKTLLSHVFFAGLRNITHNLYFYDNKLGKKEQHLIIKDMFNHDRTRMLLPYFKPENLKDLFLKICVKFNMIALYHGVMKSNKK